MAKTYVATQEDLNATNTQVTNLQNVVQDPTGGIDARLTAAEGDITNIENTIGATDAAGLRKRIADNEAAIGDANSGLTKQVNDFEALKQDTVTGAATTITESNLTATRVVVSNTSGKVAASNITAAQLTYLDELSYDQTEERFTQTTTPTATASDAADILTKSDGDTLYALTENTVQTTGFTMAGAIDMDNNDIDNINRCIIRDEGATEGYHIVDTGKGMYFTTGLGLVLSNGTISVRLDEDRFKAIGDDVAYLGDSGNKWKAVYAVNGTISTSDGTLKNKLGTDELDKLSAHWFDCVKIQSWSWKSEASKNRFGIIAQDVERAFNLAGLNLDDYAIIERGEDGIMNVSKDEVFFIESYCIRKKLGL